jgi:CRP/FNR family transcriptional regulator
MKSDIESIQALIQNYIELTEREWTYCASMLKVIHVDKKEIILYQNTVCRNIYFVVKGLLRIYFVDHRGEERTFHFSLENTFATDYESFLKRIPSCYAIQALEDTTVIAISFDALQNIYIKLKQGEKLGRLIAEDYFIMVNDKIMAIYGQTPLERYNTMNENFPKILQRVPQRYIASYLNVSSVHLSRLKYNDKEQ